MSVLVTERDVVIGEISDFMDMENVFHVEFEMYVRISSRMTVGVLSATVLQQAIEVCQYNSSCCRAILIHNPFIMYMYVYTLKTEISTLTAF